MNTNNIIEELQKLKDEKYKSFHQKLLKNNNIKLIGVRTPELKKIAKNISQTNYQDYFNKKHTYYEEKVIHGLTIGYLKIPFNQILKEIDAFTKNIDNWATCDLTAANLKQFKKNQKEGYNYIKKCIKSQNIWKQRLGIVLLNNYYINENYIKKVINLLLKIKTNEYYIEMSLAWTLTTCYTKYPKLIKDILNNKKLSKEIHNKTIKKIIESTKTTKKEKEKIKLLKIL